VGFAAANNQGMEIGRRQLSVIIEQHAFLMTDTLTQVFPFSTNIRNVGVCAGKITQSRRFISSLLC
jgi:hypothetical protein